MNRKVLLVEPNYKNKYPPMGLMKLATYYRQSGDDVRFFKGDLRDLAADLVIEDLLEQLSSIDPDTKWKKYKLVLIDYIRKAETARIGNGLNQNHLTVEFCLLIHAVNKIIHKSTQEISFSKLQYTFRCFFQ